MTRAARPVHGRHRPRRPGRASRPRCAPRSPTRDVVVVSAGSSVGARDETAGRRWLGARASGATGWRSSPASRRCWPNAPACRCSGCPATRCRRSWCSGWSGCRWCAWSAAARSAAGAERARPARPRPGLGDRPARRRAGQPCATGSADAAVRAFRAAVGARPRPTATSSSPRRRPACDGGYRGRRDPVPRDEPRSSRRPRRSRPGAAWRDACAAAGCPPRVDAVLLPVAGAVGRVTAEPVWATAVLTRRSTPPAWTASRCGPPTRSARARPPRVLLADDSRGRHRRPDARRPRRGRHARARALRPRTAAPSCAAAVPPYQHVRSIGEDVSATELLLPEGHRLRPVDVAAAAAAGVDRAGRAPRPRCRDPPDRRRDPPGRHRPGPGEIARHQLADARRAGARGRAARR